MRTRWLLPLLLASACGMEADEAPVDEAEFLDGKADGVSGPLVAKTSLDVDLAAMTATATIELERNGNVALEAAGLEIVSVTDDRGHRNFRVVDGTLRVAQVRGPLVVTYGFSVHDQSNGLLPGGSTQVWPYHCGNLYPCHSQPADGEQFELSLEGVPAGKTAIYPAEIAADAPAYQIAWAVGDYTKAQLGVTEAGTKVSVHWLPGGEADARAGTKNLARVVNWLETTLGAYTFGDEIGSVSVVWGEGMYGGMEHHPFFHVAKDAMADEETHAHEAAHGWYGDGVRIKCWEDFVLSEGTTSYLAARALDVVDPAVGAAVWRSYASTLASAIREGGAPAWPTGCNQIDIIEDRLFTSLPYMQGAFFYKDVATEVGAERLDEILAAFYQQHTNQAARMQDMVDFIEAETGFDPTPIANARLRKRF